MTARTLSTRTPKDRVLFQVLITKELNAGSVPHRLAGVTRVTGRRRQNGDEVLMEQERFATLVGYTMRKCLAK
jgi:hypothetical protein